MAEARTESRPRCAVRSLDTDLKPRLLPDIREIYFLRLTNGKCRSRQIAEDKNNHWTAAVAGRGAEIVRVLKEGMEPLTLFRVSSLPSKTNRLHPSLPFFRDYSQSIGREDFLRL
jgi:hypothetical protein